MFRRDVTKSWPLRRGATLSLDFDEPSINGIALGSPLTAIDALGPAEHASRGRCYEWYSRGISLSVDANLKLSSINCCWVPCYGSRYSDSPHLIRAFGKIVEFNSSLDEKHLEAILGPPFFRHDGDQLLLFYERGSFELVACLHDHTTTELQLGELKVQTPPTLADSRARSWYCCERIPPGW